MVVELSPLTIAVILTILNDFHTTITYEQQLKGLNDVTVKIILGRFTHSLQDYKK